MKKAVLVTLLIVLLFPLWGTSDFQLEGTGIRGIANRGSYASLFVNPANITANDAAVYVNTSYSDTGYIKDPASSFTLSFSGDSLAFTVDMSNQKRESSGLKSYQLGLDWAYRFGFFSFGAQVKVSSASGYTPFEPESFNDYLVGVLFSRYRRVADSSAFAMGAGVAFDFDWLQIGVVSDRIASSDSTGGLQFSSRDLLDTMGVGIMASTPTFNSFSRLNLLKLCFHLEFCNVGDRADATGAFGLNARLQFLPEWQVHLNTGYRESLDNRTLFFTDLTRGEHFMGIAFRADRVWVKVSAIVPVSCYFNTGGEVRGKTAFTYEY